MNPPFRPLYVTLRNGPGHLEGTPEKYLLHYFKFSYLFPFIRTVIYFLLLEHCKFSQLVYAGVRWSSNFTVGPKTAKQFTFDLKPLQDTSVDADVNLESLASSDITLTVAKAMEKTWKLSVFCPYWMLNKTGLTLQYSVSYGKANLILAKFSSLNFFFFHSTKKFSSKCVIL